MIRARADNKSSRSIHTKRFHYSQRSKVPPINVTVTVAESLGVNGPLRIASSYSKGKTFLV